MTKKILYTLWLSSCCLLSISAGCGGGNGTQVMLSGRAISEVERGTEILSDSPIANTRLSIHTTSSDVEVAHAQTDAAGSFSVALPAGAYRVDLTDRVHAVGYNAVNPQDIVLATGMPTQVDIKFVLFVP